jgi:hypothetical protein
MTAFFHDIVDEMGEEILGAQWPFFRPHVSRWIAANPERVVWLCHRIRQLMREGKL